MRDAVEGVLGAWPIEVLRIEPIEVGLINRTYRIDAREGRFALQWVNPIFGPDVLEDIAAVTQHLLARGLSTPELMPTQEGAWAVHAEPGFYRLMTWVEGVCLERLSAPEQAEAAGALLGRFHHALSDFKAPFRHKRVAVHDTEAHVAGLQDALRSHGEHPLWAEVEKLSRQVLHELRQLPDLSKGTVRVVHGDPKVSNLVFESSGRGLALIDLDTLARMPLAYELGDAMRSWCNPYPEDAGKSVFDLELFEGAARGYLSAANFMTEAEQQSWVSGTLLITLELAVRFARDALEERYFGYNPDRFPTRGAHNLARAQGQLALALDIIGKRERAERVLYPIKG